MNYTRAAIAENICFIDNVASTKQEQKECEGI